jgi:Leucine-rich repeat (LRR) protein
LYKTVNAWFFTGLKKIEEIDICANKNLRMIEAETFRWLNNLVVLNIYNNQNLKTIEKDAFSWLDLLREINLSNNSISSLPEWIFINKEHLRDYYKNDSVWDYFFTIEWISVNGNCLKREEIDEETVKILDKVASPNRAQSQKKC